MNLANQFRNFPTDDEDLKAIQMLGMRTFTAFGLSLKAALSGYGQDRILAMRQQSAIPPAAWSSLCLF